LNGKTLTAKILKYLYENPGASIKDLSIVFNVNPNTIRNTLYRLKGNGYVERVGKGYILTSKGEWFVKTILGESIQEKEEIEIEEERIEPKEKIREEKKHSETISIENRDIIERIDMLEKQLNEIRDIIDKLARQLEAIRRNIGRKESREKKNEKREEKMEKLPRPVMNIQEAINVLGPMLDELKLEGKIEIIDSIVVDLDFYNDFKKKFPIPVNEVNKLSILEKTLLDAMIKDARVIKHAGKYYKLID